MADDSEARRELERVLRRTKQLKDSSLLALIELDLAGRIVAWNRQAELVFGWSEAEALGRHFELIVPEPARVHVDAVFTALVRGELRHSRNVNVRKDGRAIVCQWHNAVLRDDAGDVYLINCEVRDVTAEEEARRQQRLMLALGESSPVGIFAKSPAGEYLYVNPEFARSVGRTPESIIGGDDFDLFAPAIAEEIRRHDAEVISAAGPIVREDSGVGPDADRIYATRKFALRGDDGEVVAICGIVNDLTEFRRHARERAELQQQVIDSQRQALLELSTPVIPVADGVLVMPLIGAVDAARAAQLMEVLLAGVTAQRARVVILDITGVRTIDTFVADSLLRAARAVKLLGAEAILTGIGPEIAATLVGLGVDLGGILTLGDLRSGVRHAIARVGSRPTRAR